MRKIFSSSIVHAFALMGAAVLSACSDPVVDSWTQDPEEVYWRLNVDSRAITIALGESDTIVATPIRRNGERVPAESEATFNWTDSTAIDISEDGVITGLRVAPTYTKVHVRQTIDHITHENVVLVNVTAQRRTFKSLNIGPMQTGPTLDTLVRLGGSPMLLVFDARDSNNAPIMDIAVDVRATDTIQAKFMGFPGPGAPGVLFGHRYGVATLIAQSKSYGVFMTDTLNVPVLYPTSGNLVVDTARKSPSAREIRISKGGTVNWTYSGVDSIQIVFDNPEDVTGGDIAPFAGFVSRTFPVSGRYPYRIVPLDERGVVVVFD